jgi:hypothetical protein
MREDEAVREALEGYLAGVDTTRALRHAFLAGVRVGARLSTLSTSPKRAIRADPLPPNNPPLNLDIGSENYPDPDPDLRSMERASARALETLELFPLAARELRQKPRARMPEDFCLTSALRAFAEAGGLDAAQEFAAFKDHFRATGECRADWPASFREWCRRARHFEERDNGRRGLR